MSNILNVEVLDSLKRATVAIGIVDKGGINIHALLGTGFFVKPGYVMTADHVLQGCEEYISQYGRQGITTEIAAVFPSWTESELKLNVLHSVKEYAVKAFAEEYPGSTDLDVGLIIPKEIDRLSDMNDIRYLNIKKETCRLSLYENVCVCGYPGGIQLLQLSRNYGMRFSPITQFGYLSSFMPFDEIDYPYGIQTDIIGTGGSSGSAIVDAMDGKVIGIAQKVFTGDVMALTNSQAIGNVLTLNRIPVSGIAKVGLIYGVSFHTFTDLPNWAKESYEKNIMITKHPLKVSGLRFGYTTTNTSDSQPLHD